MDSCPPLHDGYFVPLGDRVEPIAVFPGGVHWEECIPRRDLCQVEDAESVPPRIQVALHKPLRAGEGQREGGMRPAVDPDAVGCVEMCRGVYAFIELARTVVTPDRSPGSIN